MPTLVQNHPVQSGLLAHISAGLGKGASGTGCHPLDIEVFEHDRAEPLGQIKRDTVVPVPADAGTPRRYSSKTSPGFGMALTSQLAPRKNALCLALFSVNIIKASGKRQPFARGKRKGVGNTSINANGRAGVNGRLVRNGKAEANMPAIRPKTDRRAIDLPGERAGVAVTNPADLGQPGLGPFTIDLADLNLTTLEAEAIVLSPLPRRRVASDASKEVLIGTVQIAQGLLLAGLRYGGNPVVFSTKLGQFARLAWVAQSVARAALIGAPVVPPLFKREIVDQAADPGKLAEDCFLLCRWLEFVSVASVDHILIILVGLRGNNVDYRTGRHVIYMLHVHLVFVTKYRRDVLSEPAIRDLRRIFAKVCAGFEAELVECDGEDDHVHLLVHYPPKVQLSKLVNSLKGVSSRLLRENRPEITGRYHKGVLWSPSYFAASCGGAPLSVVAEYVKNQRKGAALPPRPQRRGVRAES